jgi:Flp pilus assembly protein TadG
MSYLRRRAWPEERAAQLVEFAVALPLLVVFVVGIFDFSNAFTLKQKLTNIARDAARTAAADPTSDLAAPTTSATNPQGLPASIGDAVQLVQSYLSSPNNINNCGLDANSTPFTSTAALWRFTATAPTTPPCNLVLIINRGYYFSSATATQTANASCTSPSAPPAGQTAVVATCVSIQYTYPWQFGNVVGLLGGTSVLPTTIVGTAVAVNEN